MLPPAVVVVHNVAQLGIVSGRVLVRDDRWTVRGNPHYHILSSTGTKDLETEERKRNFAVHVRSFLLRSFPLASVRNNCKRSSGYCGKCCYTCSCFNRALLSHCLWWLNFLKLINEFIDHVKSGLPEFFG